MIWLVSEGGGVEESIVARIRCGWMKFRELLLLLTSRWFSLYPKGKILQACVRSVVLYGSEMTGVRSVDMDSERRGLGESGEKWHDDNMVDV